MIRSILFVIMGGVLVGSMCMYASLRFATPPNLPSLRVPFLTTPKVIGFLPYWLLDKAKSDYPQILTTLSYFSLSLSLDGTIQKFTTDTQGEPGYVALQSGKVQPFFAMAKAHHLNTSLVIFCADEDTISSLLADPKNHADALVNDVSPLIQTYGFSDINIDIESVNNASPAAQAAFTTFIHEIRNTLHSKDTTISIDVSPTSLLQPQLIDVAAIAPFTDSIILMSYDYHYAGSTVTGPVAPLYGVGTIAEYDTQTAMRLALQSLPASKLILGLPLYGYTWETIDPSQHAGVIPGTGETMSTNRAASFLASCASCSALFDTTSQENFIVYKDQDIGDYHQIYVPTERSTKAKLQLATDNHLQGVALWALGYEDPAILAPLASYK